MRQDGVSRVHIARSQSAPEMQSKSTSLAKNRTPQSLPVRDVLGIGPESVIDFQCAPDGRIVLVKVEANLGRIGSRNCAAMQARASAPTKSWLCCAAKTDVAKPGQKSALDAEVAANHR